MNKIVIPSHNGIPKITMVQKKTLPVRNVIIACVFAGFLLFPFLMSHNPVKSAHNPVSIDTTAALSQYGFYLQEISAKANVDFIHHSPVLDKLFNPILPEISSMGAAVSVCDYDADGWNDFYVTDSRFGFPNCLYHNLRDGTFRDVAQELDIADLNIKGSGVSMGSVWSDFDNDGYEDLFVYKWGKPQLFRNVGGKRFEEVTEKSGLPAWMNANTAIWFDYNSDGYTDLFIGCYFPETVDLWHLKNTRVLTESFEYAQNGGRNYLLENNHDGTFRDVTFSVGLNTTRWTLAAGAVDINRDGYPELVIANDYSIDEFYINDHGKRFIEKSNSAMIGFSPKSGMNVSFVDAENKGNFGIYISNITEDGVLIQGNNFWVPVQSEGKVVYENAARRMGIENGGWSYCGQFGDLNNDGYSDLYLANGYISGKKGTDYWYDYAKVTGGNAAIISDVRNWPAMEGRTHAGYQQNKIWMNQGAAFFTDAANVVAEKESYDSRGVALADLWNRGTLDVIVANQNNRLQIYKNHVKQDNKWLDFELTGTKSNRSAIGAIIDLYYNNQVQSQVVTGGIGFCSQNQRRLHFGTGKEKADSAVITWPGGRKQSMAALPVNSLIKIAEPND
jgi:hypothetical protein